MIRALRKKFILACMFSLTLVLFVILGGVNFVSYRKVVEDADAILQVLSVNRGTFPKVFDRRPEGEQHLLGGRELTPETPYESRYFSVLLDETGQVIQTETQQIAAVDGETAGEYGQEVWEKGKQEGFLGNYRYMVWQEGVGSRIIFLDCSRSLSSFRNTLLSSGAIALGGLAAVLVLLLFLSKRIVRPVAESYEKQKQFITDAGHELKTPLTIIGADADLAEMECGENQWIQDIRRQTQRLTELTQDLIYLSRMEEEGLHFQSIDFPLSDVAEEMAHSFLPLAQNQEKRLDIAVQPMLSFRGDEKSLRQLRSILLDNALKYSPQGGELFFRLEKQGKNILLSVSNTTNQPIQKEELCHLFDRFYRTDPSRNSQTGGYGLGLSIARSIVTAHKGKIRAESPRESFLTIQVTLPA